MLFIQGVEESRPKLQGHALSKRTKKAPCTRVPPSRLSPIRETLCPLPDVRNYTRRVSRIRLKSIEQTPYRTSPSKRNRTRMRTRTRVPGIARYPINLRNLYGNDSKSTRSPFNQRSADNEFLAVRVSKLFVSDENLRNHFLWILFFRFEMRKEARKNQWKLIPCVRVRARLTLAYILPKLYFYSRTNVFASLNFHGNNKISYNLHSMEIMAKLAPLSNVPATNDQIFFSDSLTCNVGTAVPRDVKCKPQSRSR